MTGPGSVGIRGQSAVREEDREGDLAVLVFDELMDHRPAIQAFINRLVGNHALADDLTQETYIRAERSLKKLRNEKSGKSWLHSIALNLVRDNFRSRQRAPASTSDKALIEQLEDAADNQEERALKGEMSDCIARYLATMPSPQCDVLALHDMAGLSHKEIAAQLDLSEANTRVILHRGRAALQKILEENCVLSLGQDSIPCEPVANKTTS